jgi:hypothetical protein
MFVKRRRGEAASLGSFEASVPVVPKDGFELEPDCEGLMVAVEEEEDSVEWVDVTGRDTGRRPFGVSPSSDRSSQASSPEGRRGRLFEQGTRATAPENSTSCEGTQVQWTGMKRQEQTTLSRCSAIACHQCLISCLSSFLSASSVVVLFEAVTGGGFSNHPPFVN